MSKMTGKVRSDRNIFLWDYLFCWPRPARASAQREPYEEREAKPYQLGADYFGNKWPENIPSPGAFALTGEKEMRVKVWPKK
ncbi:MAG: hypothetical protein ACOYM3_08515 [Terrimicrobiaceae bacterium]